MAMRYYVAEMIPKDAPSFEVRRTVVFLADLDRPMLSVRYVKKGKNGLEPGFMSRGVSDTAFDIASNIYRSSNVTHVEEMVAAAIPFRLPSLVATLYQNGAIKESDFDRESSSTSLALRRAAMPAIHQMASSVRDGVYKEGIRVESFICTSMMKKGKTPEDDLMVVPHHLHIKPSIKALGLNRAYLYLVIEPHINEAFKRFNQKRL